MTSPVASISAPIGGKYALSMGTISGHTRGSQRREKRIHTWPYSPYLDMGRYGQRAPWLSMARLWRQLWAHGATSPLQTKHRTLARRFARCVQLAASLLSLRWKVSRPTPKASQQADTPSPLAQPQLREIWHGVACFGRTYQRR